MGKLLVWVQASPSYVFEMGLMRGAVDKESADCGLMAIFSISDSTILFTTIFQ